MTKLKELFKLQRNDNICNTPEQELLTLVKNNDHENLKKFIEKNSGAVNLILGHPYNKPILFACCYDLANQVQPDTVQLLIDLGAFLFCSEYEKKDIRYPQDDNKEAIHYASLGENVLILETIINSIIPFGEINSLSNGRTALNVLIKEAKTSNKNFLKCVEKLVQRGIDINKSDKQNVPPILWAAVKRYKDAVKIILHQRNQVVDIDTHKFNGLSARDYIKKLNIDLSSFPVNNNKDLKTIDLLIGYLKDKNQEEFIKSKDIQINVDGGNGESNLLQMAAEHNLVQVVEVLLRYGVNVNKVGLKNKSPAVEIAAKKGFHKILRMLLQRKEIEVPPRILIAVLKNINKEITDDTKNYSLCYDLLIELKNLDVNTGDENKLTPLHYAAQYGGSEKTLQLLRKGASMASKNRFDVLPIQDIDAKILEIHFNECLEANLEHSIDKEDFVTTYNYRTLMPPEILEQKNDDTENANKPSIKQFTSETRALYFMSQSKDLQPLLVHPLVTSFLYIKWHRIRWFFLTNLIFYIAFCLSLIVYILVVYNLKNDDQKFIFYLLSVLFYVTFTVLVLREIFQIIVSPSTYFTSFENWLELTLIAFTAFIIFRPNLSENVKRQISAVAILLAAFELVLLIGQHPKISRNIIMLRTVSLNFFKFLAWYSILIMAFALSFYTLFRENGNNQVVAKDDDEEQEYFNNPGISLFKTMVMLAGGFDTGSMKFQTYPITSHLIFMLFIFMIAIILLNLLNGLAVSDTQMIQDNAELLGHIARIEHIAYIESMFLSNILPKNSIDRLANYCCCLPSSLTAKVIIPGVLMRRVTLFPNYLKNCRMTIYLNKRGKLLFKDEEDTESNSCIKNLKYTYLDKEIVKRTKKLLRERGETLEKELIIEQQQKKIDDLQKEQQVILERLDFIINKLSYNS